MLYMKVVNKVNPKSAHRKKNKIFYYFFNFIPIWDDGWSLNLPWKSFHDWCKSDDYAAHLQLT